MNYMANKSAYQHAKHRIKMSFRHKMIEIFVSVNHNFMHVHARVGVKFANVTMYRFDIFAYILNFSCFFER